MEFQNHTSIIYTNGCEFNSNVDYINCLDHGHKFTIIIVIVIEVPFILIGISVGTSEANAIQFGMDQMFEASSKQLSSFIRWYFWCAHMHWSYSLDILGDRCVSLWLQLQCE